jgi:hypothetical protein
LPFSVFSVGSVRNTGFSSLEKLVRTEDSFQYPLDGYTEHMEKIHKYI